MNNCAGAVPPVASGRSFGAPQEPRQAPLAVAEGQAAEILTVELKQVEGVQHGLGGGAAAVEGVKDRDAVRTAHHGLAVERERPGAQQRRGDGNRWITGALIVTVAREQPHGIALAADRARSGTGREAAARTAGDPRPRPRHPAPKRSKSGRWLGDSWHE